MSDDSRLVEIGERKKKLDRKEDLPLTPLQKFLDVAEVRGLANNLTVIQW